MRDSAVVAAAFAAVTRRRVQTIVIVLVVLLSTATCVLALGLLVISHSPFDSAFKTSQGAHTTVSFSPDVPVGALARTASAFGVSAAAGPFAQVTVDGALSKDEELPLASVVGRSAQNGPVDRLSLDSGHWLTGRGQVVLSRTYLQDYSIGRTSSIVLAGVRLDVVGIAVSVTGSASAWVWPTQTDVLDASGAPKAQQMLYRVEAHGTNADLRASLASATRALPANAVLGSSNYLSERLENHRSLRAFIPFVVVFAVLGIVLSILITGNVVSGAVVSGYRVIGILKSIGFTPGQVVGVYVVQVLIPTLIGCLVGVPAGALLAQPLLSQADVAYRLPSSHHGVPLWVMAVVFVTAPVIVALAALGPALRAGPMAPMQALSTGRAPRAGRGHRVRRLLTASRLPRPVALGLGMPLARPARAAGSVVAILLGVVTLVLAIGLTSSLSQVKDAFSRDKAVPVVAMFGDSDAPGAVPPPPPPGVEQTTGTERPRTAQELQRIIEQQPGTAHTAQLTRATVHVAGLSQDVGVSAYRGDASWTGHQLTSGHWYHGAGQMVVSSYLLRQSGLKIGDKITLVGDAGRRTLTVSGEYLSGSSDFQVVTNIADVDGLVQDPGQPVVEIALAEGTNVSEYAGDLQSRFATDAKVAVQQGTGEGNDPTFLVLDSLIGTLSLLLCAVAALGVLNTVLLNTRERVHDIGVLKALGMTPRQVRNMVMVSMVGLGAVSGAIAVPIGVALHHQVLPAMARAAQLALPPRILEVFTVGELVLLGCAGIVLAILGALLPAGWASATRAAVALRTE